MFGLTVPHASSLPPVVALDSPTPQWVTVAVLVLVHWGNVIAATGLAVAGPDPLTAKPVVLRVTAVRAYPVTDSSLVPWVPLEGSAV